MSHRISRRDLLAGSSKALLAGACLPTLRGLNHLTEAAVAAVAGQPNPDYKALVVVFLEGGNDSFNMIVPRDATGHAIYQVSRGGMAVTRNSLLAITPQSGADTRQWGFHPAAPGLRTLFEAGTMSVVGNVGTLLAPMTKAQYINGTVPKPMQLFSHSDQATLWQLPSARDDVAHGWAGRMADLMLSMNNGAPLSPAISVAGTSRLLRGQTVVPFTMNQLGTTAIRGNWGGDGTARVAALRRILATEHGHPMARQFADLQEQAIELDTLIRGSLEAAPALATTFPGHALGQQLRMVARMIGVRAQLGAARQVYFVREGGWDTHDEQLTQHPRLLSALSESLVAFQAAMVELGVASQVTTATLSEFGRTLTGNARGTDHGWGGNQLVMGGAVRGRRIFGTMPDLALGGPADGGLGRIIPTTAVEQYAATLATWFGVPSNELAGLFPRLSQFASSNLGFMV
ncbi:MAG: DUF1501 domain-containing protein [Planctomycetes bacterium]|nr:DUF1501 domain-containing protein [Planctomycetota bacterium]